MLIKDIINLARTTFQDGYDAHYQFDDITYQSDGVTTRFRVLNRNLQRLTPNGNAPLEPTVYKAGAVVSPSAWDYVSGAFTLAGVAAGSKLQVEYYFCLVSDSDFINLALDAARFLGLAPTFTALTDTWPGPDNLVEAAQLYMASLAAGKMADLSSWYYQANAGNKSFNKDMIAKKFQDRSTTLKADAAAARKDPYTRFDQGFAPASAVAVIQGRNISRPYTPRR